MKPGPRKCGEARAPEEDASLTYSPSYGRDPENLQNQSRESDLGFGDTFPEHDGERPAHNENGNPELARFDEPIGDGPEPAEQSRHSSSRSHANAAQRWR